MQHAAVCLASVLVNNPDLSFDIVIAGRATTGPLDEGRLRRSLEKFSNYSLTFYEFLPPADLLLPLEAHAHQSIDAYARLWVGQFFPEGSESSIILGQRSRRGRQHIAIMES